jgi:hypothetical protein
MKRRPAHGVLVISIDVNGDSGVPAVSHRATPINGAAATLGATKWLLALLDECRLPATWFFTGPGTSVLRSHVVGAKTKHEVGLLALEAGQGSGRLQFRQSLQRRVSAARAAGIEVTSLAASTNHRIDYLDLLVKHGIRAVRFSSPQIGGGGLPPRQMGWSAVSTLRFGISSLPATLQLCVGSGWRLWIKNWELRRQISAAAAQRHYCHLALDVHDLAQTKAREALRRALRVASRLVGSNQFQAETVSSVAASLMARPTVPSARSILRAA